MQNKMTLLDMCTNGSYDNLANLIGPVHNQFDKVYNIITSGMIELSDNSVSFSIINNSAVFDIGYINASANIQRIDSVNVISDNHIRISLPI